MRVFVAINLPSEIKNKIEQRIAGLQEKNLPARFRWIRPENWHLTICFLGDQKPEHILVIEKALQETVLNFSSPLINFESLSYGPQNKPYMIWLNTCKETSRKLSLIKEFLENKLFEFGLNFKRENRKYNGHLTLARAPRNSQLSNLEEQFSLNNKVLLKFTPSSLDLIESTLIRSTRSRRGGAEYETLLSIKFNKLENHNGNGRKK